MKENTIELLSPAGSMQSLQAAVLAGADAVYLGCEGFNARTSAKNFTKGELPKAIDYCHLNGVKVHLTINTLVTDREEKDFLKSAVFAADNGVDAFIVQDIGMAEMLHEAFPDMPLHASTQMSVHNLEGVLAARDMGLSRVILARELPFEEIEYICKNSPIEIEVFVHGALCMSYSGQCYMSGIIGERSGNRGRCAQPCRLPYKGMSGTDKPLSLKDLCAAAHLSRLKEAGVSCIKIEGRLKRPEYVAVVTKIYKKLLKTGKLPSRSDIDRLETVFSRGFTDAYLTGDKGPQMLGTHVENEDTVKYKQLISSAALALKDSETTGRVGINFDCIIVKGKPSKLTASDMDGNFVAAKGALPQEAINRPIDFNIIQKQLQKVGGTPYFIRTISAEIGEKLSMPLSSVNELRRRALSELSVKRTSFTKINQQEITKLIRNVNPTALPKITLSVLLIDSIGDGILQKPLSRIYLPLSEIIKNPDKAEYIGRKAPLFAIMPRVLFDSEWEKAFSDLKKAAEIGVCGALCTNLSHIKPVLKLGLSAGGDFSLNVFNSRSVMALKNMGLSFYTPSFELSIPQIRDLGKYIEAEGIVYGRLPMMLLENPPEAENNTLTDRKGEDFYIHPLENGRGELYNAHPLYLSDKIENFCNIGLSSMRICLTLENAKQGEAILESVITGEGAKPPKFTRGLYYKGVE
jgi:putative protease